MSNWNALLASINKKLPNRKILPKKEGLRNFQNLPELFYPVVDDDLQEAENASWKTAVRNSSYEKRQAKKELDRMLEGRLKDVGMVVIASGKYGTACKLPPGRNASAFLQWVWEHASLRVGKDVLGAVNAQEGLVVKFVRMHNKRGLEETLRETRLHVFASNGRVEGRYGYFPDVNGNVIVPRLYFGCLIELAGKWWFTTVMAMAAGAPLNKYLRSTPLTAAIFAAVEKAVYSLWILGVAHADFHPGNIMYDPKTQRATILDLGFAVKLPDHIVQQVRGTAAVTNDASLVYDNWISKYVSSVIYTRGGAHQYAWFNPDGRVLSFLYNNISNKTELVAARIKVWTSLSLKEARAQIQAQIGAFYPPSDPMEID